jgi:DNA-binding transcriptional ArsR family regulator
VYTNCTMPAESQPPQEHVDGGDDRGREVLAALTDPKCRAILRSVPEEPVTAAHLAESVDLPLSTMYRKLDQLTEVSLMEETTKLSARGRHPQQYDTCVEAVEIQIAYDDGDAETHRIPL